MTRLDAQLVLIAKTPVPGQVKTRLTPPFTPAQAASLAAAALADTAVSAARVPFARRVLALGGDPGAWGPPSGFELAGQRGGGLDERIAAALDDAHARLALPTVLIGMDTPQVSPPLLWAAGLLLARGDADAVVGPASDGGFWLLGLRRPDRRLVLGVPMSRATTGRAQVARLRAAGLRVRTLPALTDVDTAADALEVARRAPRSRFAAALAQLRDGAAGRPAAEPGGRPFPGPAPHAGPRLS